MDTDVLTATDETELLPSVGDHLEDRAAELCQLMIEKERLREEDLQRAQAYREQHGGNLLTLLVRLGLVSERDLARSQSELLDIPMLVEGEYPEEAPQIDAISVRYMKQRHIVPVRIDDSSIEVVMADPLDQFALRALGMATDRQVLPRVGVTSEIDNTIERYFGGGKSAMGQIAEHLGSEGEGGDVEDVEHLRDLASEAPVIRVVNLILQRAVESRASDIHIEPFENRLKVRYRIDGVLQEVEAPPARSTAAVISRVKIMARLNIAERRLPQDGRIMHRVGGKELDLRVSTVPTAHGESVVMRILDREAIVLDFGSLGFAEDIQKNFERELEVPHGIILVTGPTGSGKTTTLYTALSKLNTPERKIITVEDPVEYQLEGINQIQAQSSIGLDFSRALRSIVRQDPDVIMIGEMRDLETAKIAIQSALTGHLVLSTLHTNDAAGGVTRMIDMGVEDYLLASTVNAIMAQRLVRRLDPATAKSYEVLPEMAAELGLEKFTDISNARLYRAVPSEENPTGYRGRTGIHELLVLSEEIRRLVMRHATASEIEKQARVEGMRVMYEDGLIKALAGVTSAEEVLRVTQEA